MSVALLLDEHYSDEIASALRAAGHDAIAVSAALLAWLTAPDVAERPDEDWLV